MTTTWTRTTSLFVFILAAATLRAYAAPKHEYQPRMDKDGWEILFDGKNLDAWSVAPGQTAWVITPQGELQVAKAGPDLGTKQRYCDFEVEADFRMGPKAKANSGVFVHTHHRGDPVNTGIEIQILDNNDYGVPFDAGNANGAIYDLVRPAVDANLPVGEWNHFRITDNDNCITVILNGKQIAKGNMNLWKTAGKNPDGSHNKFPYAIGALPQEGFVMLQNYGGTPVWFRNVRLKKLSDRKPRYTGAEPMAQVLEQPK